MLEQRYYLELNEIPIFNFDHCLGGKMGYIRRDSSVGNPENDFTAWCQVYDQYLSKYGIGTKYSIFLDKMEELTILYCDFVLSGDKFLQNRIRILENEIKEYGKGDKSDLTDQIVLVSKWMGGRVNPRETSADEFFSMIKQIEKEQENGKKNRK